MNGDASSSNPPPPSSTLLAPGFRFHPTDEELVIYYLKRKVSGRPLRVDAIAEVDLYKVEPWDLPSQSRLQSRDVEWYFFSPLDRKYANRSRTNRATAEGYWKTTGKDRPVRHGSRIVGMKKTLVFHVGRAPRGERTNWVMHEYRLEDEDLAGAGIAQDAYVVCRIFQKSGSGPQNGAQYGAPFVEEEWEGAEDLVPVAEEGAPDVTLDAGNHQYLQLTDLEQKKDLGVQYENTPCFAAEAGEHDGDSCSEDLFELFEDVLKEQSLFDDLGRDGNAPERQDGLTLNNSIGEDTGVGQQSHPDQNDGYVELQDIWDNANVDCPREITGDYRGVHNDQISANGVDGSPSLPERSFMGTTDEIADPLEPVQVNPSVEGDFSLLLDEFLSPLPGDYASGQPSEDDMVFYDAPGYDLPFAEDSFENMTELPFSPVQPEFDMVDDLMAYFDATDNNIQNATLELPVKSEFVDSSTAAHSNSAPEVEGSSYPAYEGTPQAPEANADRDPSSSARSGGVNYQLERVKEEGAPAASDTQMNDGWNKIIRKHVVGMLGSISAPPAMAGDSPPVGKSIKTISTTHSSSSIHVTAGMIQIHDLTMVGSADHWTLQKNGGMGFLFSYDMAGDDVISKSECFEPIAKMQTGALSAVLRNGVYLFCVSMLLLSISFKVGTSVYIK